MQARWKELTLFAEKLGFEKGAYIIVPKIEGRVEDRQPICLSNHTRDWSITTTSTAITSKILA